MRVTLISVYESITAYGLRVLSAMLKRAGFEARLIFLPRETEGRPWDGFRYPYSDAVLDQVADLCEASGLIGISLSTNYFFNALQVTGRLRQSTSVPLAWGGVHPTVCPEECLRHADIVCVGEGEEALLELAHSLARGEGYVGISNMWYRENGQTKPMPLRPLLDSLDAYPYPDYDLATSFVLHQGRVRPMTQDLLLHYSRWPYASDSPPAYETLMSRGCSYRCTYCCNDALRRIYRSQWRVRRRSVSHLLGELQQVTACFPGFQLVRIIDDEFISDQETVREFCDAYRQAIGLPFEVDGFQPPRVKEENIDRLVGAGMKRLHMGIQTGSLRTMHQLYRRPVRREQIVQAAQVLHKFVDRMDPPTYDLILDNPWETEQDELDTLALLLDIPRPYELQLFSLTLDPGTELCERGKSEGLLSDEGGQVYQKHYLMDGRSTYMNGLFKMVRSQRVPRALLLFLMRERVRALPGRWLVTLVNLVLRMLERLEAGWHSALRRDWRLFAQHLHYLAPRHKGYKSPPPPQG